MQTGIHVTKLTDGIDTSEYLTLTSEKDVQNISLVKTLSLSWVSFLA